MSKDKQETPFSDWMLTVPLTDENGEPIETEDVKKALQTIFDAGIGQKEQGEDTGYVHFQFFGQMETRRRFSTLKKLLTEVGLVRAHMEHREGTVAQAIAYCCKDETRLEEPIRWGEFDYADGEGGEQGRRRDLERLKERAENGESLDDILTSGDGAKVARYMSWMNATIGAYQRKVNRTKERDVKTNYLYGATGTGKTRYVYEHEGIENVYTVTDYEHPFDEYDGEPVLLLDEFTGQFKLEYLLRLLDRYPMQLRSRYRNKWAQFTKVWILSNQEPESLYPYAPESQRKAVFRRIAHYYKLCSWDNGEPKEREKPNEIRL